MPSSALLLCPGETMLGAFIDSASSAAAGFPKENLIDWNPDTYWKPTAVGTANFIVDLGSAKSIEGWALWLRNAHVYLNPGPGQQLINVYYSTDKVAWTLWDFKYLTNQAGQQALFICTSTLTPQSKRYWKVEVVAPDLIVEVSMVFLYKKFTMTQGNQTPESVTDSYTVKKTELQSGRVYTRLDRSNSRSRLPRTYLFVKDGDWATIPLVQAFHDVRGTYRPLILVDDSQLYAAKLVRFGSEGITRKMHRHQIYGASVEFVTEAFITLGKTL